MHQIEGYDPRMSIRNSVFFLAIIATLMNSVYIQCIMHTGMRFLLIYTTKLMA